MKSAVAGKQSKGRFEQLPVQTADGAIVPLGADISWDASVESEDDGILWYRYRITMPNGTNRLIRDFGPDPTLNWTSIDGEGFYTMEVTVRDLSGSGIMTEQATIQFVSLLRGNSPAVTPTSHPQVVIYSEPACAAGSTMRVEYTGPSGAKETTPEKACTGAGSMNFYVGGLRKQSAYTLQSVVKAPLGTVTLGPALTAFSGTPVYQFANWTVTAGPKNSTNPVMVYSSLFEPTVATDLDGNVIWYYLGPLTSLTRPEGNGLFLGFFEAGTEGPEAQLIREFDLAGNTQLETNAARINEQLMAMGLSPITGFHHEVRRMPNGNILALAGVERTLTDIQGPGDVDVLGDMILVLNPDLEVVWAWNAFDYLDPTRTAVLGETCLQGGGGCAPFHNAPVVNDWLHGNAVQLTPDGNLLYSARHQDWILKIDYQNGGGSGQVIWRLGKDGDFQINSDDPYPWFSHQHDPNFDLMDPTMVYVFDNGNTRQSQDATAHSRGQAYQIDENSRTVTPVLNADLGAYSLALGSAAKLPNGNYHFDLGWIPGAGQTSRSVEVDSTGAIVYGIQAPTAFYRTFRLPSIYAPEPNVPSYATQRKQ